jgi:hypothetical protein
MATIMARHSSSHYSLASHRGGPGSSPGLVKLDLWWTKWRWCRFSPSTSVSPASLHSTKYSIIIITQGRYNRPVSGRRAEWTQLGLHPPPLCELKKGYYYREVVASALWVGGKVTQYGIGPEVTRKHHTNFI